MLTLFAFICTTKRQHFSVPLKMDQVAEAKAQIYRMNHYAEIITFRLVVDKRGSRWISDSPVIEPCVHDFVREFLTRQSSHPLVYRYRSEITQAEGFFQ